MGGTHSIFPAPTRRFPRRADSHRLLDVFSLVRRALDGPFAPLIPSLRVTVRLDFAKRANRSQFQRVAKGTALSEISGGRPLGLQSGKRCRTSLKEPLVSRVVLADCCDWVGWCFWAWDILAARQGGLPVLSVWTESLVAVTEELVSCFDLLDVDTILVREV